MQKVKEKSGRTMWLFSLFVFCSLTAYAQKTISGTVTEAATGEPVIGASIQVKGTKTGTVSDLDGNFELSVPENGSRFLHWVYHTRITDRQYVFHDHTPRKCERSGRISGHRLRNRKTKRPVGIGGIGFRIGAGSRSGSNSHRSVNR